MHSNTARLLLPLFFVMAMSTSSCKKFLAAYSQNNSFIETATDLDELLTGEAYFVSTQLSARMLYDMDDDSELGLPTGSILNLDLATGYHYWQPNPRISERGKVTTTDDFLIEVYKRIAGINTIIFNVPLIGEKGGPQADLDRISGEAHFLRAFYYFILVNTYGKPYKPATASSDFGVPLKTDPAIKDKFAARNSTQQLYDQIISDLLIAEQKLAGANMNTNRRVNPAAAQALLARVYLFMENYEKSILYADKLIGSNQYQLKDLNTHIDGKDFLKTSTPEVIFTMGTSWMSSFMSPADISTGRQFNIVSNDLAMIFSPEDLRFDVFFERSSKGFLSIVKKRESNNSTPEDVSDLFLLRLAEQYLNKAEALAALDRFEEARNTLQEFRKFRFRPADLSPITVEDAALMSFIRDERRRELCFEGHRWFDLRRYGVNSKYPFSKTIRHRSIVLSGRTSSVNGYYELKPYDQDAAAYIVPFPQDEIEFNQGAITNEARPERPRQN